MSFGRQSALIVGGAALIAGAAIFVSSKWFRGKNGSDGLLPALTEEETKKILGKFHLGVKSLHVQLSEGAQRIKKQFAEQGQDISEDQIRQQLILPNFTAKYKEMVTEILVGADVLEQEFEEAVTEYSKTDDEIKEKCEMIRHLYVDLGGDLSADDGSDNEDDNGAPSLTLEQLIRLMNAIDEKTNKYFDDYVQAFIQQYGHPAQNIEGFMQGYEQMRNGATENCLHEMNCSTALYSKAIEKYHGDAEFISCVRNIHETFQTNLLQLGIMIPGLEA